MFNFRIEDKKFYKMIKAIKRTIFVFEIIGFGVLLGMSMSMPFPNYVRFITLGIMFVILVWYNYMMDK